jgi:hypothetical protein
MQMAAEVEGEDSGVVTVSAAECPPQNGSGEQLNPSLTLVSPSTLSAFLLYASTLRSISQSQLPDLSISLPPGR